MAPNSTCLSSYRSWNPKSKNRSHWDTIKLSEGWVICAGCEVGENLFPFLLWFWESAWLKNQPWAPYSAIFSGSLLLPFPFFFGPLLLHWGVLVVLVVKKQTNKHPPAVQELGRYGFNSWVGQIRWRRQWLPTPVFLPGESHGQRSLVGYTVHGVTKDLDMTEATQHVCTAIKLDPPS